MPPVIWLSLSPQHFTRLREGMQFGLGDWQRHMAKPALAGQQQPLGWEIFERWLDAPADDLGIFQIITALVDHA